MMKRTMVRAAAVALAVVGLSMAPAAAAPNSLEIPGAPGPAVTAPGGAQVTPDISPCKMFAWFIWCRM